MKCLIFLVVLFAMGCGTTSTPTPKATRIIYKETMPAHLPMVHPPLPQAMPLPPTDLFTVVTPLTIQKELLISLVNSTVVSDEDHDIVSKAVKAATAAQIENNNYVRMTLTQEGGLDLRKYFDNIEAYLQSVRFIIEHYRSQKAVILSESPNE